AAATAQIEIVGGKETEIGKHRYLVGLKRSADSTSYCGGSLVAPGIVLTAAHCINSVLPYVAIGVHNLTGTSDGELIRAKEQFKHPKFTSASSGHDAAILLLETDSQVEPVEITWDDVAQGIPTVVRGWGTTSEGGKQSQVLKEVGVDAWDNDKCAKAISRTITDSMICAGGLKGEDSCQGDSGGPLTVEADGSEKLVGIVSWGIGCARENYPGVYTRLSQAAVREFVEQYVPSSPTDEPSDDEPTDDEPTDEPTDEDN
ncbi:hypothetical protein As57867_006130, partial [Aphanomyces stellatus]